jgi:hypothetical protein
MNNSNLRQQDLINTFNKRPKLTLEAAKELVSQLQVWLCHILDNQDGTYSILNHAHNEVCDYCLEQRQGKTVHIAKADPCELIDKK